MKKGFEMFILDHKGNRKQIQLYDQPDVVQEPGNNYYFSILSPYLDLKLGKDTRIECVSNQRIQILYLHDVDLIGRTVLQMEGKTFCLYKYKAKDIVMKFAEMNNQSLSGILLTNYV